MAAYREVPVYPGTVHSPASARRFLRWCCRTIGIGFHPDVDFREYEPAGREPEFEPAELLRMERMLAVCFSMLEDVYAECLAMPPFCNQR